MRIKIALRLTRPERICYWIGAASLACFMTGAIFAECIPVCAVAMLAGAVLAYIEHRKEIEYGLC